MHIYVDKIINEIESDKPDPAAAKGLQEALGGQFGEMRTLMQYEFQSLNFRGNAKPFLDSIRAVATEEVAHVELVATTINLLLDGNSEATGGKPDEPNSIPLQDAMYGNGQIHHFLVAGQSSQPVDAAGNPWSALYIYDSGNLVLNLLYNVMLECTGRLQKSRLYQMTKNKAFRSTIAYLIVRDMAHEKVFAKALEALGVDWGKVLPVPKLDSSKMPEVRRLEKENLHNMQWTFSQKSEMDSIFQGSSPFGDGELETLKGAPEGFECHSLPDRHEEFAPGLDKELLAHLKKSTSTRGQPVAS